MNGNFFHTFEDNAENIQYKKTVKVLEDYTNRKLNYPGEIH